MVDPAAKAFLDTLDWLRSVLSTSVQFGLRLSRFDLRSDITVEAFTPGFCGVTR